ncbi:Swt1 family HEPN domain-containing protein, partial [Akkermansiaceae bacterium]|nr:Swt1 family HEPN domain-containing protein [Akkermansiaceae bacterium]
MNLSEHRRTFARELITVLETNFTEKLGAQSEWWESHVISLLSYGQRGQVRSRGIERLGQLDLHALLRVFDRNWGEMSYWCSLGNDVRTLMKGVADQRNDSSHEAAEGIEVDPADLYR